MRLYVMPMWPWTTHQFDWFLPIGWSSEKKNLRSLSQTNGPYQTQLSLQRRVPSCLMPCVKDTAGSLQPQTQLQNCLISLTGILAFSQLTFTSFHPHPPSSSIITHPLHASKFSAQAKSPDHLSYLYPLVLGLLTPRRDLAPAPPTSLVGHMLVRTNLSIHQPHAQSLSISLW